MKNSKLLMILLPIAAILFWYLGRPPVPEPEAAPAIESPTAQRSGSTTPPPPTVPTSTRQDLTPEAANSPATQAPQTQATPTTGVQAGPVTGDIDLPVPASVPVTGNPNLTPDQKLEALRHTFRTYASRHKGNPVGDNAEITAALAGKNPGGANYIADGTHGLNDQGQLCDGWGTPYFFHQLSGTEMEIRSAGPDKKMWNSDDLVIK